MNFDMVTVPAGGALSKRDDGGLLGPGCRGPPYSSVC